MSFAHNHNLTTSTAYTAKHLLRSEKVQTTLLNHLGSSQLRVRVHVRERVKKKKKVAFALCYSRRCRRRRDVVLVRTQGGAMLQGQTAAEANK